MRTIKGLPDNLAVPPQGANPQQLSEAVGRICESYLLIFLDALDPYEEYLAEYLPERGGVRVWLALQPKRSDLVTCGPHGPHGGMNLFNSRRHLLGPVTDMAGVVAEFRACLRVLM
jgi:hypothetical protein